MLIWRMYTSQYENQGKVPQNLYTDLPYFSLRSDWGLILEGLYINKTQR